MSNLGLTIHPYALFIAYIWHNVQLFSSFRVHVLLAQSVQVKEVFLTEVVRVVSEFVAVSPAPAIPQLIRMELISKALQLFHPSAVSWLLQSVKIYVRLKFFLSSFMLKLKLLYWNNQYFIISNVQVRLNFETLSLSDPDGNGDCKTEYVQVCQ